MGIDPGLTRCGVGIVDVTATRSARLVDVSVIRTPSGMPLEQRLLSVGAEIERLMGEFQPQAMAVERVFAQQNLGTVMGVAQISGVALYLAAARGLSVGLHTPTEVKAAITGYGAAEKLQVATMVARVLGLSELPKPADAADALAIALCHAWNRGGAVASAPTALTKAQQTWLAAERSAGLSSAKRRLAP